MASLGRIVFYEVGNRLDRLAIGLFASIAVLSLAGAVSGGVSLYHWSTINTALEQTISDPASLEDLDQPEAHWQGQIRWSLTDSAVLLCGADEFGEPRATVAKARDGMIRDELWAERNEVWPEVTAFCAIALQG